MGGFRNVLTSMDTFTVTCELVPGRGYKSKEIDSILKFADGAKNTPQIHALSLTDNAGGNPALSADVLGQEINNMGVDCIVHFTCKDMNRNTIERRAYALWRSGVSSLLVITGDYPASGYLGIAKPVFDMDSVGALFYLNKMNEGLEIQRFNKTITLEKTDFFLGASVSPFKWTEGSCVSQYVKLEKKIRAGAQYIIIQLGFDARKHIEMIRYLREYLKSDIPVMGSVYILSSGAARVMNAGEVPGCYVGDEQLALIRKEAKSEDKGKDARLTRAARQIAILKGLGYNGVHIEGLSLKIPDVTEILSRADDIGDNWRDHLPEFRFAPEHPFYFFKGGEEFDILDRKTLPERNIPKRKSVPSFTFWTMRLVHKMLFIQGTMGYKFMVGLSKFADKRKWVGTFFSFFEKIAKRALFDCRGCDDCALFELYYLCPESQCPKGMRVGPCGGANVEGRCEVFEENFCVWERIYRRAKNRSECEKLRVIIPPRNWALYETSSWINYFLGRDHSANKLEVPEGRHNLDANRTC